MWIFDRISLTAFLLFAATVGLAPFVPEPHIWEKLKMLAAGDLVRLIDWGDLAVHGAPWLLLALKLVRMVQVSRAERSENQ